MALTKIGKEGIANISNSSDATAITIDSSENVMFGTTTFNPYSSNVNGVSIRGGNTSMQVSKDGQVGILINRKTSDGQIVQFGKDGTAVGNIGSYSGSGTSQFYISGADTGFKINSSVDVIAPSNNAGANRDNAITLGDTSNRWKDLYLSGNVFIGGTGSANALDDYEEGTWTPSVGGDTTYDNQIGRYVKIGNQVTLWFYIQINQRNSPGVPYIAGGSPFTNSSSITGSGLVHYFEGINNNAVNLTARIDPGGANINISGSTGSAATVANVNHDWVKNGADIYGFVTHYTG